jgi:hypothetical protein
MGRKKVYETLYNVYVKERETMGRGNYISLVASPLSFLYEGNICMGHGTKIFIYIKKQGCIFVPVNQINMVRSPQFCILHILDNVLFINKPGGFQTISTTKKTDFLFILCFANNMLYFNVCPADGTPSSLL